MLWNKHKKKDMKAQYSLDFSTQDMLQTIHCTFVLNISGKVTKIFQSNAGLMDPDIQSWHFTLRFP